MILLITLYYLKDQGSYQVTVNILEIGLSAVSKILREIFFIILTFVGPDFIKFPKLI